jgi:hypothetical protein
MSATIADLTGGNDVQARVAAAILRRLEMLRRASQHSCLPGCDSEGAAEIRQ